jgi:hypothetical protein
LRALVLGCALVFELCAVRARVRADDWLAVMSACNERALSEPTLELVYPNEDLPAVVAAGDSLFARVRVPAALTPPPGVQQERALSGWSAELIGEGVVLGRMPLKHRHSLPVVSVRPDAGSSLLYRVRMAVPAYAAPGTYTLRVRTPFGDREVDRALRVIAAGALPRMAALPSADPTARGIATLPVDVWIDPATAAHAAPPSEAIQLQPRLAISARAALALRVGSELWVSDACARDRDAFEADVRSVLRIEKRVRVALSPTALPPMAATRFESAELSEDWQRLPEALRYDNRHSHVERQLLLLLPADASVRVTGASLTLYPASDLQLQRVLAIAGRLQIAAGAEARVELGAASARAALVLEPALAESGAPTVVRVRGAASDARVAFDYGFARTALGGPLLKTSFAGPLEQPLRALVLTPAGGGQLVRGQLSVDPHRPPSCAITMARGGSDTGACGLALWLLCARGFLLKRRPRRGFGNRLGPQHRCQLRDRASHVQNLVFAARSARSARADRERELRRLRAHADSQHARRRQLAKSRSVGIH